MNGYDRFGVWCYLSLDVFRIDSEAFVDIDENRDCSDSQRRNCCGYPSVGGDQPFIARSNARSGKRRNQRTRATIDREHMFYTELFLKLCFKAGCEAGLSAPVAKQLPACYDSAKCNKLTDPNTWHKSYLASQDCTLHCTRHPLLVVPLILGLFGRGAYRTLNPRS